MGERASAPCCGGAGCLGSLRKLRLPLRVQCVQEPPVSPGAAPPPPPRSGWVEMKDKFEGNADTMALGKHAWCGTVTE